MQLIAGGAVPRSVLSGGGQFTRLSGAHGLRKPHGAHTQQGCAGACGRPGTPLPGKSPHNFEPMIQHLPGKVRSAYVRQDLTELGPGVSNQPLYVQTGPLQARTRHAETALYAFTFCSIACIAFQSSHITNNRGPTYENSGILQISFYAMASQGGLAGTSHEPCKSRQSQDA